MFLGFSSQLAQSITVRQGSTTIHVSHNVTIHRYTFKNTYLPCQVPYSSWLICSYYFETLFCLEQSYLLYLCVLLLFYFSKLKNFMYSNTRNFHISFFFNSQILWGQWYRKMKNYIIRVKPISVYSF